MLARDPFRMKSILALDQGDSQEIRSKSPVAAAVVHARHDDPRLNRSPHSKAAHRRPNDLCKRDRIQKPVSSKTPPTKEPPKSTCAIRDGFSIRKRLKQTAKTMCPASLRLNADTYLRSDIPFGSWPHARNQSLQLGIPSSSPFFRIRCEAASEGVEHANPGLPIRSEWGYQMESFPWNG
jgi:hypothetical protein